MAEPMNLLLVILESEKSQSLESTSIGFILGLFTWLAGGCRFTACSHDLFLGMSRERASGIPSYMDTYPIKLVPPSYDLIYS